MQPATRIELNTKSDTVLENRNSRILLAKLGLFVSSAWPIDLDRATMTDFLKAKPQKRDKNAIDRIGWPQLISQDDFALGHNSFR